METQKGFEGDGGVLSGEEARRESIDEGGGGEAGGTAE